MYQTLDLDRSSYSDQSFSSWEAGWRSMLLDSYTLHSNITEMTIPPLSEYTIVVVTEGRMDIESRGSGRWVSARYQPGTVALNAPQRLVELRWQTVSPTPLQTLHLAIPSTTIARHIEELWDRDPDRVTLPDTLATSDHLLESMVIELARAARTGVDDLYAESAVPFIVTHLLIRHSEVPTPQERGREDDRVRSARAFLRHNLDSNLSLSQIATEVGMSPYHFLRVFRTQTGETPFAYLSRLRVARAEHELVHTSATVAEIAAHCGFASPPHLATVFRRHVGSTPTEYRRTHGRFPQP